MLLIVAGAVYLTIGIKNPWLHIFLSVTLLGNLATTVLILYVMTVPVSDAIQGAYLVAITLTGLALGAGSTIFKEVTEGLGCILGGFSVAMWVMTLVPGGLIQDTAGKSVFIAGLSLAAFGLFFSHYTRDYAVIGLIAFGGATATVLGVDCYTRAGLKEFWAYIWDLNENLFPAGAHGYPVTKGMRVESAVIVLLFLIGVISQMKLWRVIQERRDKKAAEKAEDERNLQAEEEAVGREVEERTARERRVWERAYGDGNIGADVEGRDSGFGALSEKRMRVVSGSTMLGSLVDKGMVEGEGPLSDATPDGPPQSPPGSPAGLMASGGAYGDRITVRIVPDEFTRAPDRRSVLDPEEQVRCPDASQDAQHADLQEQGVSRSAAASPPPDVVPLPFQVHPEDDEDRKSERSSIAGTCADDEGRPQSRHSLARRLSQGPTNILRSLSQRTKKNLAPRGGESREMLVRRSVARSDDGSLVATVDGESLSDERSDMEERRSIEITADFAEEGEVAPKEVDVKEESAQPVEVKEETEKSTQPTEPQRETAPARAESVAPSETPSEQKTSSDAANTADAPAESNTSKRKSPSETSMPLGLRRDTLPEPLSRIALKYRTNEWVKHSTTADAPEPEEIHIDDTPEAVESVDENPAPLFVEELQQTATTGTPAPAPARSSTAMPNYYTPTRPASRAEARVSTSGRPETTRAVRKSPSGIPLVDPIPEEPRAVVEDDRSSSRTSASPSPFQRAATASPAVVPYSDPQTLMGRRETYIRNKPLLQAALNGPVGGEYSSPHYAPRDSAGYAPRSRSQSPDEDDMPLSQRRAIIRQSSAMTLQRPPSTIPPAPQTETFNSHQPQRASLAPPPFVREAQLANFRQSVAVGLRAGTPTPAARGGLEALMREREAEAMAREAERWEAERREGAFVEAMRSGELAGAHREALRRMQGRARES